MIPTWALSVFAFVFLTVFSIAAWGIKQAIGRVDDRLNKLDDKVGKVQDTVNKIDRRVVRVETIIDSGDSGDARRRPSNSSITPLPPAA
ncbi:hypothetical protein LCGC14_2469350 [marine sediment metagenome]|uniref:Uncharacterized protein n=1 Tax=marine sediment metagenome TaxID=412755 RepID=A0A0F9BAS1_9ZZZZ